MKEILNELLNYKTLDKNLAKEVLLNLAAGRYNNSQMASFLTVFMMRSITVEELEGFRDAMLEVCIPVNLDDYDAMDLCGTGGDGKNTFNISTLSSFIVAGAGQHVAKHGNNGVSSVCGSSNLLAHFGYEFSNDPDELLRSLDEANICFLHAPLFHPAMKNVAPVRQELGVKTFFNMLGPMVNPSFPSKQMVGVFSLELARLYGYLYQKGKTNYAIVHSLDGYDEISLTGPFKMVSINGEDILTPSDLGMTELSQDQISGGDSIEESAIIFHNILNGKGTHGQQEVVIANAGIALFSANPQLSIKQAVEKARVSLISGKALKCFKALLNKKRSISLNI